MDRINELLKLIDTSLSDFIEGLPQIERQTFNKLNVLLKDLEIKDGNIKNSLKNLKLIPKIKSEVDKIVLSKKYLNKVKDFAGTYNAIAEIQNDYFASLNVKFTPKAVYNELKKVNIQTTVEQLTEAGIGGQYSNDIKQLLRQNITSGGSYADLTELLRSKIIGVEGEDGLLVKYSKQITTDAINQYNAQYVKAISDDLGFEWYAYTGSNIETTRPFCREMTKKYYFHKSEIYQLLNGNIDGTQVHVSDKTDLPDGMIEGTNESNFVVNRGGYNCGHIIIPIPTASVPDYLVSQFT